MTRDCNLRLKLETHTALRIFSSFWIYPTTHICFPYVLQVTFWDLRHEWLELLYRHHVTSR